MTKRKWEISDASRRTYRENREWQGKQRRFQAAVAAMMEDPT